MAGRSEPRARLAAGHLFVWTADVALQRVGLTLVALKLAAVPLALDLQGADVFALPKVAASHALSYAIVAVLSAYLIRVRMLPLDSIWIPLAAYLALAAVATTLSPHPFTALYGAPKRLLGFTSILDGALLALAIATFVRTARDLALVVGAALGASILVLAYGLVQLVRLDPLRWSDLSFGSTIGNSGAFAGYLVLVAGLALAAVLVAWHALPPWQRAILGGIAGLAVVEVLWVGARSPALALPVMAASAVAIAWRARSPLLVAGFRALGAALARLVALVLAVGAAGLLALFASPAGARIVRLFAGGDTSTMERWVIYRTALDAITAHPVFGVGPDAFVTVYLTYRPPESVALTLAGVLTPMESSTHSWVLHQALSTGLAGLLAFLATIAVAARGGWTKALCPEGQAASLGLVVLVVYLAQGLFNVNHVATELFLWLALGLLASPGLSAGHAVNRSAQSRARGSILNRVVPAAIPVLVGVLLAATVANSFLANRMVHASNRLRELGEGKLAETFAESAIHHDPRRADYWNVLGLALAPNSPERALQAFERAAELAPYDSTYPLNGARQGLRLAERDRRYAEITLRHAERAVEIDPLNSTAHLVRGYALLDSGNPAGAVAAAERALVLAPTVPREAVPALVLAADAYQLLGLNDEAVARLRVALELAKNSELELSLRLDLGTLLAGLGRWDEARALVRPPRVRGADRTCVPRYGVASAGHLARVPRCLRIVFVSEAALQTDEARGDAVTRPSNFAIDGSPLPLGSELIFDEAKRVLDIHLPMDATPPRPGAAISVSDVADRFRNPVDPNPSVVSMPYE